MRELTHAAYAKWVPVIGRAPLPMTVDYEVAVDHHEIDLLLADETLLGLIELTVRPDDLLIVNVAVAPAAQGHGYGRMLLDRAETVARQANRSTIRLYTNALFAENIRIYLGRGYQVEREEAVPNGTLVHMLKLLQS